ncbi:MAG: DUF1080 domain-containing protein [Planctomycetota bacterium]
MQFRIERLFVALATITALASSSSLSAQAPATAEEQTSLTESVSLFNGKDLSGWVGRDDLWSVEDGQIVGRTTADAPLKGNTFLIYEEMEPADFELTLQFKIENTNSGVQFRSKVLDKEAFVVGGYQADIDFSNQFAGILYEEKGRGILAKRGFSVTIDEKGDKKTTKFADGRKLGNAIHPGEWNDYRIVAKGKVIKQFINETKTIEVIDNQTEKAAKSGVIALQLHRGDPMVVRFKNIVLHPVD